MEILEKAARFLYFVDPNKYTYEKIEDIPKPDFVQQAVPYFITLIILEYIIQWIKDKPRTRINDGVTSVSAGVFMLCEQLLVRGVVGYAYIYVYENWRLFELPWDSPYTWYAAAILGDLCYYWAHRAGHEINLFWALHQVHHSSEDYNLTTALRQSIFQSWFTWMFYVPTALFLPPQLFLIHQQFNTIYQFWIHTEVIDSLGPLEYIFNTPRHHRVHHGCNRYCLDKNYGGVLIIWDRLFGTFEDEQPGTVTYGLVEDIKSFDPTWLQFFYLAKIWSRVKEYTTIGDKLSAVFKGPGWFPGQSHRLGDSSGVAEYPNRAKYDPKIPLFQSIYVLVHFFLTLALMEVFSAHSRSLSQFNVIFFVGTMLFTLTSLGLLLEGKRIGILTEVGRCFGAVLFIHWMGISGDTGKIKSLLLAFFLLSLVSFSFFGFTMMTSEKKISANKTKKLK